MRPTAPVRARASYATRRRGDTCSWRRGTTIMPRWRSSERLKQSRTRRRSIRLRLEGSGMSVGQDPPHITLPRLDSLVFSAILQDDTGAPIAIDAGELTVRGGVETGPLLYSLPPAPKAGPRRAAGSAGATGLGRRHHAALRPVGAPGRSRGLRGQRARAGGSHRSLAPPLHRLHRQQARPRDGDPPDERD